MSIAPSAYHDAMKLLIIEDEPKTAGYLTRGLGEPAIALAWKRQPSVWRTCARMVPVPMPSAFARLLRPLLASSPWNGASPIPSRRSGWC